MTKKYSVLICDDSAEERARFYERQYENFDIYGVKKVDDKFVEFDKVDSPDKLYKTVLSLIERDHMPDLVLLDLFYKRPVDDSKQIEREFIEKITAFKNDFRNLKSLALSYLVPSGIDFIKKIRLVDKISKSQLPIYVYTDKNFNFLPSQEFNALYELDPGFLYKDRDDDEPRSQIPASSEYFRLLQAIEFAKTGRQNRSIFISHGHSSDWTKVQSFLEQGLGIRTVELGQAGNFGRTAIQALEDASKLCSYAVIVMTGDDVFAGHPPRARENVIYEIGYFQGKYAHDRVCIIHEDGTSIPSNLGGILYLPYQKGHVEAVFTRLRKELSIL